MKLSDFLKPGDVIQVLTDDEYNGCMATVMHTDTKIHAKIISPGRQVHNVSIGRQWFRRVNMKRHDTGYMERANGGRLHR